MRTARRLGAWRLRVRAGPEPAAVVLSGPPRVVCREVRQSPPLVGRELDLAVVLEQLKRIELGAPVALLVRGEAGIGKSRLVAELVARARTLAPHRRNRRAGRRPRRSRLICRAGSTRETDSSHQYGGSEPGVTRSEQ
jgi:AAA ATPase domain